MNAAAVDLALTAAVSDGVVELSDESYRRGPMFFDEIFAVNYVVDEIVGGIFDFLLGKKCFFSDTMENTNPTKNGMKQKY